MERPVGFEPTVLLTQESFADSPLRPSRARTHYSDLEIITKF